MAVKPPYPHAGFLDQLTRFSASGGPAGAAPLPPALTQLIFGGDPSAALTPAGTDLIPLLTAQNAMLQAAFESAQVADELRRYQKHAKPGQLSPHSVQLRQQQSAARLASSLSKQSYIKSAAAFVRDAAIAVPEKVALELYITRWININVPKDVAVA